MKATRQELEDFLKKCQIDGEKRKVLLVRLYGISQDLAEILGNDSINIIFEGMFSLKHEFAKQREHS